MKVKSARSEKKDLWKVIPNGIWAWIESYTRGRARKTGYLFGLNSAEVDDLHQELMIDVAKRWRFYDPMGPLLDNLICDIGLTAG